MSLLAEEIVEEWLNRQGYFTIRGIHLGVHEMDLLAVRCMPSGTLECRHLEVQASMRPVSYICSLPRAVQRSTGRPAQSAKRSDEELVAGVAEWVTKKFDHPKKVELMHRLAPGPWTRELVVHRLKWEQELDIIRAHGVTILRLDSVAADLRRLGPVVPLASGADFVDLIQMGNGAGDYSA